MLMRASTETLRNQNCALVLSSLRKLGPVSHTDISEWTGLSSATISAITGELEARGILLRLQKSPAKGRGRPRVQFCQNPDHAYIAAIRITADKVEYSLVDYGGTLKDRFDIKRSGDTADIDAFARQFQAGLERLAERSHLPRQKLHKVSITSKGLVARGAPKLLWSPIFANQEIDFDKLLRPDWQADVSLTNETRFSARAIADIHSYNYPAQMSGKFATLSLGDSVGLGIAERHGNGRITSFAPPFGHMMHQSGGALCRCGLKGCIEAYAGFYGILRAAFEVTDDVVPAKFIPLVEMERMAIRARSGDAMVQFAFRQAGEVLGIAISRLHSFMGTMPVAITGKGLQFFDLMQDEFEKNIRTNLQMRFDEMPKIHLEKDESNLIFKGNIQATLGDLDNNLMAIDDNGRNAHHG